MKFERYELALAGYWLDNPKFAKLIQRELKRGLLEAGDKPLVIKIYR